MRGRLAIGIVLAALVLTSAAAAENYQYKIVTKDKEAANAIVFKRGDLGGLKGWTGGAVKPDRTPETEKDRCYGYLPKQSDLVVTGDAETTYRSGPTTIDTQVNLLRTAEMVETDWKRSIGFPHYLDCARKSAARELPKGEHLVSVTKLAYPRFGTKSAAYRVLFTVNANRQTIPAALDAVLFYRGRTEVSVIISGAVPTANDRAALKVLGTTVAKILERRAQLS